MGILPFVVLHKEASEESNFENLGDEQESEKQRTAMYSNEYYQNAIKPILRRFDEHHVLDELAALSIWFIRKLFYALIEKINKKNKCMKIEITLVILRLRKITLHSVSIVFAFSFILRLKEIV